MSKKKLKRKAGAEKPENKSGAKETQGPTEKDLFEMQIDQLKQQLGECDAKFQERREDLERVRNRLEYEVDSEVSCVSYLKRVLDFDNQRRLDVQEKLQTLRDQSELMEKRVLRKFASTEKSREAVRSQFLQQKLELEGKLFLLEEKRLKRNSQMVHLKRAEEALERKTNALREKNREEDMRQVAELLEKRDEFLQKCRDLKEEWLEVFHLRMPVHAKKQLEENVRLREACDRASGMLIQVQDRNRNLKASQKSLEVEEEIQSSAEEDVKKRKVLQEKHLHQLLEVRQELRPTDVQESHLNEDSENNTARFPQLDNGKQDAFACKDSENSEPLPGQGNKVLEASSSEDAVKRKMQIIEEGETQQRRLLDRWEDATTILKDQTDYRSALEEKLEWNTDQNGAFMSAILRAGQVFETRCGKLNREREQELDFECLQQMRLLLDGMPNGA